MKKIIAVLALCFTQIAFSNYYTKTSSSFPPLNPPASFLLDDCDACGCSANGGSMGFSSMLNENFVGIRYFHQSYKSRDGVFNNSPWIDENFNTAQIWGRIPVSERIEITALIPYHFHRRIKTNDTQNVNGIGDLTVMAFYTAFKTKTDSSFYQHKILVGGGVKAPTGDFDSKNNGSINPSFQVGTGSWDYTVATEYIIRRKRFGLNTALNYIFKTENESNYKFGDQFNYGTTLFYTTSIKNLSIVPQIGIAGETYKANQDHQEDVPFTKGDIFFSKVGVEAGYKKFSAGVNAMLPINQNLTGGRVEANYRLAVNLNYTL
ncbi:transporter [Flavobacterium sp. PLA-1-15]|uniref:transporter n=1 Tax=Flavobacterium sp. PLA-1-15 TaxID=3380533 RepID=UPI003B81F24D